MSWKGEPIASGWTYTDDDTGARIILDHLHRTSRGLEAWVELRLADGTRPVSYGRKDLMAPKSQQTFAEEASRKANNVSWSAGLDQAFYEVIQHDREGTETIDLATYVPRPTKWLLHPLLEEGGHTRIIAPGDSGKSFFALAMALAVATGSPKFLGIKPAVVGPVMYNDWETDADTHAERVHMLCEGAGVPMPSEGVLLYQEQSAPLYRIAHQVHRVVDTFAVKFLVIDSVMLARGAGGDRQEDSAIRLFEALRGFTQPALLIDHKSAEAIRKGRRGGYGSVVNQNSVRLEWEMTRFTNLSRTSKLFALSLEKHNNTGRLPSMGFRFEAVGTSATFQRTELSDFPSEGGDLGDQIFGVLMAADEPMFVKDLVARLDDTSESSVRKRLNDDDRFENRATKRNMAGKWMVKDEFRDEGEQLAWESEIADDDGSDRVESPPDDPPPDDDDWDVY